jgi:hypothetical protein
MLLGRDTDQGGGVCESCGPRVFGWAADSCSQGQVHGSVGGVTAVTVGRSLWSPQ